MAVAPELPSAGDVFDGKYRIVRSIGEGGMGVVLEAEHLRLERRVAIKLLLPAVTDDPEAVARFLREARAASKLTSVHVAHVYDVDLTPDEKPYIVMELLEGQDIAERLRAGREFSLAEVARILAEACIAMAEAHALGIVHRDLKPSNLFLSPSTGPSRTEIVKVLDFGISKLVTEPMQAPLTEPDQMVGTVPYMSPEQIRGVELDARSDIWSLGVIAYELLAGRRPFRGDSLALAASIVGDVPAPIANFRADVPTAMSDAVMRALSKSPDDRFPNVRAFADALVNGARDGTPASGPVEAYATTRTSRRPEIALPEPDPGTPPPWTGTPTPRPWRLRNAAIVIAAFVVIGAVAAIRMRGTTPSARLVPPPPSGVELVIAVPTAEPSAMPVASPSSSATSIASAPRKPPMHASPHPSSRTSRPADSSPTLFIP